MKVKKKPERKTIRKFVIPQETVEGYLNKMVDAEAYKAETLRLRRQSQKEKAESIVIDRSDIDDPAVKDRVAYGNWKRAAAHRLLNEDKILFLSDETEINLGWFPRMIQKKMAHLPKEEQKQVMIQKSNYLRVLAISNNFKQQAYGYGFMAKRRLSEDGTHKDILYSKRHEIIELFGRMFSPEEVHRVIVEQYRIPCSLAVVRTFREKFTEQITEKVTNFKKEISDMRLSNKRGRLEELVWLYTTMKKEYERDRSTNRHKSLVGNLEQIRKEVEGDSMRIEGDFMIKLEANLNQHLQFEIFKQININQIIIGRVASRIGASPEMVICSLMDSYYKGITGIVDEAHEEEYDTIEFPSIIPYDFGKIQQVQQELQKQKAEKGQKWKQFVSDENESSTAIGLKDKLMQLVLKSKDDIKNKEFGVEVSTSRKQRREERIQERKREKEAQDAEIMP